MFALRSARSRAIAAGALGLLLLASVAAVAGMAAATDQTGRSTLWLSIGLSTAAFVAVATTVTVVILSTIRPLAALRASARAITAGDPQATAKVSGPEEVASLARDFNAMTDALAAKAKEYIDTTNLTGVTLLRVDKDNRVTFLNDAMCQFLGKSREEILGTPIVEYLHPGDVASTTEAVRQMARSKRLARGIMSRYITPMGTRVTEWNGYPIFDEEGRYAGVHGTGRDITERKRAEDALRESEERFRTLSEATFEGVAIHDRGKILDANPTFAEMFGYELSELIGMDSLELAAPESRGLLRQSILSKRQEPFEAMALRKDGTAFLVEIRGRPARYREQAVGLTAVRDITARKRAEEALRESEKRLRSLFEASPDAIILSDLNTNIIMVNHQAVRLLGYDNAEEVIGRNSLEFIAPEDRQRAAENALRTLQTGAVQSVEYTILRKDGTSFPAELSASSIVDAQGRPQAFTGVVRDITQRRRAEQALQKAREDIESRVERRMQQVNGYGLTFRELAVLHLVAAGESDKEIATVLSISPLTAHKHIANILEKMGAASRTEAGVRALREGLLD